MVLLNIPKLIRRNYSAITLYPFIILKNKKMKEDAVLMNHERIHLRQQVELLLVGFYLWYGIEFLIHYIKHKNWYQAYHNISFEKESYGNEKNLDYLKNRKIFSFLNYL